MGWRDWFGLTPVTAAASVVQARQGDIAAAISQTRSANEVWEIWRCVGEIHYSTTQQARLVSRLEWDIEQDGELLEHEESEQILQTVFGNQLPELAKMSALHLQVAGGYYLARVNRWHVLPYPTDHASRKLADDADILVKVVTPDPREPKWADSPVMAAAPVARELLLARAQARATARNRTAQLRTVLYPREGAGPNPDQFEDDLIEGITAPLTDEFSSSSVVPNIIGFSGEWIDKWKTLDLTGPIDDKLYLKIDRLVRQIAVILDVPAELLTGMGDTNHWSQWAIQEDNWLGHVEPLAKTIGDGFAEAIGKLAELPYGSIQVIPDPAPLLQRRPALADVLRAYELGLVNGEWTRAQLGADEGDAPASSEQPTPAQVEQVPAAQAEPVAAGGGLAVLRHKIARITDPPPALQLVSSNPTVAAPPALPFNTDRLMAIDRQVTDSVIDLADDVMGHVLNRVGAKLRARLQGDPALRASLADVPNDQLPSQLPDQLAALPGLDDTVTDTIDRFGRQRFTRLVRRAYSDTRAAGVSLDPDPDWFDAAIAVYLSGLADLGLVALQGNTTAEGVWRLALRAIAIAGGSGDPDPPQVAAPMPGPFEPGIALGRGAVQWIHDHVGVAPVHFIWEHNGGSGNDHPEHAGFDGVEFDGNSYEQDGIQWYPGDHAGCRCSKRPVWEETQ